jgi:hypothetical protein
LQALMMRNATSPRLAIRMRLKSLGIEEEFFFKHQAL